MLSDFLRWRLPCGHIFYHSGCGLAQSFVIQKESIFSQHMGSTMQITQSLPYQAPAFAAEMKADHQLTLPVPFSSVPALPLSDYQLAANSQLHHYSKTTMLDLHHLSFET
jgi:hypothetical protein